MRIRLQAGEANRGLRWGVLAAALLTDLAQEGEKSKAKGVFKF